MNRKYRNISAKLITERYIKYFIIHKTVDTKHISSINKCTCLKSFFKRKKFSNWYIYMCSHANTHINRNFKLHK